MGSSGSRKPVGCRVICSPEVNRLHGTRWRRVWLPCLAALALLGCDAGRGQGPDSGGPPAAAQADAGRPARAPAGSDAAPGQGRPARDLRADERRGGHTLERHVGRTDAELRARLRRERRIAAASTYDDLATAERVVGETLRQEQSRVRRWAARQGRRPNLALDYESEPGIAIGRSLRRGARAVEPCHDAIVVLKWDDDAGDYFVLTSYPEVRR